MSYQSRWVRGVETPGDRACAERYELVRAVAEPFSRQLTIWDLGANLGYFGCRLADAMGAVTVMVDQRASLVDVVRENAIPTTIAMTHALTTEDLRELAHSEHADIVLALNVLHHCDDPVAALFEVVRMGESVVIETPGRGDVRSANFVESQVLLDAIEALQPELIGQTPSHVTPGVKRPIYLVTRQKPSLERAYAYGARVRPRGALPVRPHVIRSNADRKTVTFAGEPPRPWVPGMNLWNWLQMGGSYPSRASVQAAVKQAGAGVVGTHGDIKPWNVVLQGEAVQIIDAGHRQNDDAQGLADTLQMIAQPELAYAQ